MDESQIQQELEKHLDSLYRTIEQGDKVHNLTAAPEWEFFESWLRAVEDQIVKKMKTGSYINDHNGYIYSAACTSVIDSVFKGIDKFKKAYEKAQKELVRVKKEQKESQ